jgi:hypothetical protein
MNNGTRPSMRLIFAFVLCAALFLLIVTSRKSDLVTKVAPATNETISPATSSANGTNVSTNPATLHNSNPLAISSNSFRANQVRIAVEQGNVPIDFFGKVVDQDGAPLAGVQINANVRAQVAVGESYITVFPKTNLASDADGFFEIQGMKGDALTLESLKKDGYEANASSSRVFNYGRGFSSDRNAPVILKMWKTGQHATLIKGEKFAKISTDGRHYAIDLINGTISEAQGAKGDLQVWIQRAGDAQPTGKYKWAVELKAFDGGILQETDTQFAEMTSAPGDGYTNGYASSHEPSDSTWTKWEADKMFYVQLNGGKTFGRVDLGVDSFADRNSGLGELHIQYAVNPSGSKVLR